MRRRFDGIAAFRHFLKHFDHGRPFILLHGFDYPLYFFSVRANAGDRIRHFFAKH